MELKEILKKCKVGDEIRFEDWDKQQYIRYQGLDRVFSGYMGARFIPNGAEILESKWEFYEESRQDIARTALVDFTPEQQARVQELIDETYKKAYLKASKGTVPKKADKEPVEKCEACELFGSLYGVNPSIEASFKLLLKQACKCKDKEERRKDDEE